MTKILKNIPIKREVIDQIIKDNSVSDIGKASIRETKKIIDAIELQAGLKFIRMEMGIPGLPPSQIAINAEIEALKIGVAGAYPAIDGVPKLKTEISKFCKLFLDLNIKPQFCIPTSGSINASFLALMTAGRRDKKKDTVLFIDPGFPAHKQSVKMIGLKQNNFDVYDFRGNCLKEKLESYLKKGNISVIIYSNPNNPTWISFTETELKIIGELASKYDVVVTEDLAYLGMDSRYDYLIPGRPPFQPTITKYTDNYIVLISSSKSLSYAGQRIGMMMISEKLYDSHYPDLFQYYPTDHFGDALIYGTLLVTTAGVSHSVQYGLAAILKAANNRELNLGIVVQEYSERAVAIKKIFCANGFKIVYDRDGIKPLADGFYFTVFYPNFTGDELVRELFAFGISTISLSITGSDRVEGIRICVSLTSKDQIPELERRLKLFNDLQRA